MHPEAGTVRVGPGEAETIARNTLASHSTSDDLMIVEELPGRKYLLSGLISQLSVSLSSWKPAWRRRLRHSATAAEKEPFQSDGSGLGGTGATTLPLCPGHLPWKGEGLRFTNLRSSRAAACTASLRALPVMATWGWGGAVLLRFPRGLGPLIVIFQAPGTACPPQAPFPRSDRPKAQTSAPASPLGHTRTPGPASLRPSSGPPAGVSQPRSAPAPLVPARPAPKPSPSPAPKPQPHEPAQRPRAVPSSQLASGPPARSRPAPRSRSPIVRRTPHLPSTPLLSEATVPNPGKIGSPRPGFRFRFGSGSALSSARCCA